MPKISDQQLKVLSAQLQAVVELHQARAAAARANLQLVQAGLSPSDARGSFIMPASW
jgi:hypothetical protein